MCRCCVRCNHRWLRRRQQPPGCDRTGTNNRRTFDDRNAHNNRRTDNDRNARNNRSTNNDRANHSRADDGVRASRRPAVRRHRNRGTS